MSLQSHPNIIRDAFLYFAKFPQHERVMEIFTRPSPGSLFEEYESLRTELGSLEEKSLVPGLKSYVYGPDEQVLRRQIEDIGDDIFLFLDYGNIMSYRDQTTQARTDEVNLAITVARPYKPEELDIPEMVLLADQTLNIMRQIRDKMQADQECSPFMQQIEFPHETLPWYARELANSQGWTMVLKRTGIAML